MEGILYPPAPAVEIDDRGGCEDGGIEHIGQGAVPAVPDQNLQQADGMGTGIGAIGPELDDAIAQGGEEERVAVTEKAAIVRAGMTKARSVAVNQSKNGKA